MEAFEVRLELVRMAKNLLMEEWHANRHAADSQFNLDRELALKNQNGEPVKYPSIAPVPSTEEITKVAVKLNAVVSVNIPA
jgi:hypothetical protein